MIASTPACFVPNNGKSLSPLDFTIISKSYCKRPFALFKSCDHAAPSYLLCPIASSKVCKEFSTKDLAVST